MIQNKEKNPYIFSFSNSAFLCITDFQYGPENNVEAESKDKSVERLKKLMKMLSKIPKFVVSANILTHIFQGFLTQSHWHRNPQCKTPIETSSFIVTKEGMETLISKEVVGFFRKDKKKDTYARFQHAITCSI